MSARILVVEDSPTQLENVRSLLSGEGYDVRTARSGEEALAVVREHRFQLVLSDVVMPGMSGYELCKRVKEEVEDPPPFMLLTSLNDPRDIVRGVEARADNYITKPYEPSHLLERINRILTDPAIYRSDSEEGAVSVTFLGETFTIRSDPAQILSLLLSSFEELIRTNRALEESQRKLADAHARELESEQAGRARAEEDARRLEILRQKAESATQARDEVLAAVSHDLKNPLGTIFTSAGLLLDVELPPEAVRRQLEIIQRTAMRMDRLIKDLLDVSRLEAGVFSVDMESESARSLLFEAREAQQPNAMAKSLELEAELPNGDARVSADRTRIQQVFANLVGNAIKFTPEGGAVTLRGWQDGKEMIFSVQDTGSGISEEDLPRIFDRFWQAGKTRRGGAGLGLAIAKGIVVAHEGRIWAESSAEGSTFYFTLPLAGE